VVRMAAAPEVLARTRSCILGIDTASLSAKAWHCHRLFGGVVHSIHRNCRAYHTHFASPASKHSHTLD